ncbi:cationic peroxidase 1-like [Cryptomeria japonica]|uniref:cationic peroxidase 1-like n=1 Tax=Cryptomeria japonica TaxID=3369 RepID=UPI0025ACE1FB|nr:cationic peroxidase 1-like [Cryptomeria japonica]
MRNRIYEESNVDPVFAESLRATCPRNDGIGNSNLSPFDIVSPNIFDNNYFKDLMEMKGLLLSDQVLLNGRDTAFADAQVALYSNDQDASFSNFQVSMVNMGNIKPLTGTNGQIRKDCRNPN